jgi:hypothetical protein
VAAAAFHRIPERELVGGDVELAREVIVGGHEPDQFAGLG